MNNQNSDFFCPDGSDLASRLSARHLRGQVEQSVATGKIAIIDLRAVLSIAESYSDELFAVLVAQHGLEWFTNNISLLYSLPHSEHVLNTIATTIRRRLEHLESLNIKASVDMLIADKKSAYSNSANLI